MGACKSDIEDLFHSIGRMAMDYVYRPTEAERNNTLHMMAGMLKAGFCFGILDYRCGKMSIQSDAVMSIRDLCNRLMKSDTHAWTIPSEIRVGVDKILKERLTPMGRNIIGIGDNE